jgi:Helix-turn-helix domain
MRGDMLTLDIEDAAWFLRLIRLTEQLATRQRRPLPPEVAHRRCYLEEWVASRASGRAHATNRPAIEALGQDELIDTRQAARRLGITPGAVAKRCRTGYFASASRKVGGVWMIPAADVDAELNRRNHQ